MGTDTIDVMVKIQVQIPDYLYDEAKRIAQEYDMSFDEVVRLGLEKIVSDYPPRARSRPRRTRPNFVG
jgi:hypothetical protein